MPDIRLNVVASAEGRAVLSPEMLPGTPAIAGKEEFDYLCGKCGTVIGKNLPPGLSFIADNKSLVLIACTTCKSFNEIPFLDPKGEP